MKDGFTKQDLFSCPIYKIRIDPNSYDKEEILKDIKYNKSLKNTRNEPHQNFGNGCDIHHSYSDFDNEDFRSINYEKLCAVYQEIFHRFFDKEIMTSNKYTWKFEIVNYSAITESQWFPVHNHMQQNDFATVHYLNFKNEHRKIRFKNPINFTPFVKNIRPEALNILDNTAPDNLYLWENFKFPVKEDDMLIFPAALNHEIPVQGPTKEPRITISTNIEIQIQVDQLWEKYEKNNN